MNDWLADSDANCPLHGMTIRRAAVDLGAVVKRCRFDRFLRTCAPVLVLSTVVGCSDGRPERVQVSGQVLIDGEPLQFGFVRFVPSDARPATGRLDDEGRFSLTCYGDDDGVVRGTHKVEVAAGESLSETKTKWHAPKKYAYYQNSELTETIEESTDSLIIRLTWDGGEPYIEVEE